MQTGNDNTGGFAFPVDILSSTPYLTAALPLSGQVVRKVLDAMCLEAARLSREGQLPGVPSSLVLALVTGRECARINKEALGCVGPTNILSFPGEDFADEAELALCVEMLWNESLLYGQDPAEHLIRLLAHGLAHVCGLDHGPQMDECQSALEEAGRAAVTCKA